MHLSNCMMGPCSLKPKLTHPSARARSTFGAYLRMIDTQDTPMMVENIWSKTLSLLLIAVGIGCRLPSNTSMTTFPVDDVSKIIKSAVEEVIERNTYQHSKVKQWADKIVEQVLSNLKDLNKPFKYIATCVIMQKNGAGLHTASSCYWDNTTDGSCTVRWENKSMYCIVFVFGLAI